MVILTASPVASAMVLWGAVEWSSCNFSFLVRHFLVSQHLLSSLHDACENGLVTHVFQITIWLVF